MRTRKLLLLSTFAAAAWAGVVAALDAPHDGSIYTSVTECQSCHKLHSSTGGTLTSYNSNNHACLTCHGSGLTDNNLFTNGWATGRESSVATAGTGDQHNWSGLPTGAGARRPTNPDMLSYLPSDATAFQCAVCHDVHGKRDAIGSIQKTLAPNSVHASWEYGVAKDPIVLTGTGLRLTLNKITNVPPGSLAKPAGYRIKVISSTQFQISHDYAAKMALVPPGTPTWTTYSYTVGSNANTDDPLVTVKFTTTGALTGNPEWSFYVSYPFLRASNDLDAMCVDCHADRVQDHLCIEGSTCTADGTKVFSHPVAQALNANGKSYDRAAPIDADGTVGSSLTDGYGGLPNPGNDLKLVGGAVRCTTCHAPHNAGSNSLSVEVR